MLLIKVKSTGTVLCLSFNTCVCECVCVCVCGVCDERTKKFMGGKTPERCRGSKGPIGWKRLCADIGSARRSPVDFPTGSMIGGPMLCEPGERLGSGNDTCCLICL